MYLTAQRWRLVVMAIVLATNSTISSIAAEPQDNAPPQDRTMPSELVYVGTYAGDASQGIYLYRFVAGEESGRPATLEPLGLAAESPSSSFLELDPQRRLLFAVNEAGVEGVPGGAVSAYRIGPEGKLTLINQQSTRGGGPCHLCLDKTGRFILAANYVGGSVAVIPVADDGRLLEASDFVQHEGRSVNPQRQEAPHAHFVTLDPSNRFALVCDLGIDQVLIYRFDAERGTLTPNDPPAAKLPPGAGPRHLAFHPNGRIVYVINELNSTIAAFAFDAETGAFSPIETVSTLPPDFRGENTTAEIAVHPAGKFVYASNRGHDSIAAFQIDEQTGKLAFLGATSTRGKTPRHFEIDPRGEHMLIGNQNSNSLLLCRIDSATGGLEPVGKPIKCGSPACARFLY